MARERGTYNILKLREEQEIRWLVIDVDDGDNPNPTISPVTMESMTTEECTATMGDSSSSKRKKPKVFRKSPRQASTARLEAKIAKEEYDVLYKAAFKEATNLLAVAVAGTIPSEPVKGICNRLNAKCGLVSSRGKKKLSRSMIYQAAKDGLAG